MDQARRVEDEVGPPPVVRRHEEEADDVEGDGGRDGDPVEEDEPPLEVAFASDS
jgi:hypothetical protein